MAGPDNPPEFPFPLEVAGKVARSCSGFLGQVSGAGSAAAGRQAARCCLQMVPGAAQMAVPRGHGCPGGRRTRLCAALQQPDRAPNRPADWEHQNAPKSGT